MKLVLIIIYVLFYSSNLIKLDPKFYHQSTKIDEEIENLLNKCNSMNKEISIVPKTLQEIFPEFKFEKNNHFLKLLKYYDISIKNENRNKLNAFILAGEHPRELISTELIFSFLLDICNKNLNTSDILNNFNLRIIVNANPTGRILVEKGEYCLRTNVNNVDINRNWNEFWGKVINTDEESPGDKPFSEIETQFLLNSIKDYNPKLFLTIHSGVYGLYLPYAFLQKEGKNTF